MHRPFDRKVTVLGLTSLVALGKAQLPAPIVSQAARMVETICAQIVLIENSRKGGLLVVHAVDGHHGMDPHRHCEWKCTHTDEVVVPASTVPGLSQEEEAEAVALETAEDVFDTESKAYLESLCKKAGHFCRKTISVKGRVLLMRG